jgi:hypothetical protein
MQAKFLCAVCIRRFSRRDLGKRRVFFPPPGIATKVHTLTDISRARAEPAFYKPSRRSAPALAQRTGGSPLLCVPPCWRASGDPQKGCKIASNAELDPFSSVSILFLRSYLNECSR